MKEITASSYKTTPDQNASVLAISYNRKIFRARPDFLPEDQTGNTGEGTRTKLNQDSRIECVDGRRGTPPASNARSVWGFTT
jgi:hypothetical protein